MKRLDKFREIRITRRKFISSFFLFFALLTAGVLAADYSVNFLMQDVNGIRIISVAEKQYYIEIGILNYKFDIDTSYIKRDLGRLKKSIGM